MQIGTTVSRSLAGTEQSVVDQRLARRIQFSVAGDGVDLAVVRDPPERWANGHDGKVIRGEPRAHNAQRAGQPIVLQVQIERFQLRRGQHALVDEGVWPERLGK